jgi:hypothetical protein
VNVEELASALFLNPPNSIFPRYPGLRLSSDEFEVAEASVKFALENCPVDGLLSASDGTPVTLDETQALLDKVRESHDSSLELDDRLLVVLGAVMDYTSQNCPVESVSRFQDGRPITGKDIISLTRKLAQ